jgi:inosose dehydratase
MSEYIKLANAPVSWGVDHMGRSNLPPWQKVFSEMADAGFKYTELGPLGYLPEDGAAIREGMRSRNLTVIGAALLEPLADPAAAERSLEAAWRLSRLIAQAGGKYLVIVDWVTPERNRTAGRADQAPRLSSAQLRHFHAMFERVGRISKEEFGVQAVAHAHGGTYLEFEDEIEALLAATNADLVQLAIDTGHSVFAGIDPVSLYERHVARTSYVNFKDASAEVIARVQKTELTFFEAVDQGVFCRLGTGLVDFRSFVSALQRHHFNGPAVIEQDRDPDAPGHPLADARESIAYLRGIGLQAETQAAE